MIAPCPADVSLLGSALADEVVGRIAGADRGWSVVKTLQFVADRVTQNRFQAGVAVDVNALVHDVVVDRVAPAVAVNPQVAADAVAACRSRADVERKPTPDIHEAGVVGQRDIAADRAPADATSRAVPHVLDHDVMPDCAIEHSDVEHDRVRRKDAAHDVRMMRVEADRLFFHQDVAADCRSQNDAELAGRHDQIARRDAGERTDASNWWSAGSRRA